MFCSHLFFSCQVCLLLRILEVFEVSFVGSETCALNARARETVAIANYGVEIGGFVGNRVISSVVK